VASPAPSAERDGPRRILLLTQRADEVSGGHLFHRRLAAVAARHDATMTFGRERLLGRVPHGWDVVIIDSIAAWRMAPTMLARRRTDRSGRRSPVVAMVHQIPGGADGSRVGRRLRRFLDLVVYRRCDGVLASSLLRDALIADHGLDAIAVRAVEPGCDLPPGTAPADMRRGRRIAVVNVANWLPNKGVLALLDAVAGLDPDDVTLHLVGRDDVDTRYTARVRERLRSPDLATRVVVHGTLDQTGIADLYAGADLFVHASTSETYAIACAEALAAGLPVVGWRRAYLEGLVSDGVEGRLVPPDDIDAFRDALRELACDDPVRLTMSAAAQRRGAALPTWRETADQFFGALDRLTEGRHG